MDINITREIVTRLKNKGKKMTTEILNSNEANEKAIKFLTLIIKSTTSSPDMKKLAITALGDAGGMEAVKFLTLIIKSTTSSPDMKKLAITALGKAGRIE